jgi:LCP family protein required for cell wall assembly
MSAERQRRRRRLKILLISFCVLAVVATGTAYFLGRQLVAPIDRIDGVFNELNDRPTKPTSGTASEAFNILLLGTDRRSETPSAGDLSRTAAWIPDSERTDAILLLHVDGDRQGATIVSLPRDAWVPVPGYGHDKIGAAYARGGPSLAVETVEKLTDVRIDHLAVVDWEGIRRLTDELGGITVTVPETVDDPERGITWTEGQHELDGQAVLDYLGQREGLPDGDRGRARRMQSFLRVLMLDTLGRLSEAGPWDVYQLLKTMTNDLSVDAEWSNTEMAKLAWSMRDVDDNNVAFLSVPVASLDWEAQQSVIRLDQPLGARLWDAVRDDRVTAWLREHPEVPQAGR